ncbi:MAG: pantothenate kinase [Methanobacteriota archaeon]
MDLGVLTEVKVEKSDRESTKVLIDGKRVPGAKTTLAVVKQILSMARGSFKVKVNHFCQVPIGAGYGASGAGALGTALALSKVLGLRMPRQKLVAAAHVAEVICYTGLGDVGAQAFGGLVIGLDPGAPPYGRWSRIKLPTGVKVVCATLGPIASKDLLSDAEFRIRASGLGRAALDEILEQPDLPRFVSTSKDFAKKLGLLDEELRELVEAAEKAGAIGASQAMIGRTVFAFVVDKKVNAVKKVFLEVLEPSSVLVAKTYDKRANFSVELHAK